MKKPDEFLFGLSVPLLCLDIYTNNPLVQGLGETETFLHSSIL